MGDIRYGATAEQWKAFIALARDDVRPVVSDPTVAPSQASSIKDPLKVPTIINRNGEFAGLIGWQSMIPSEGDLMAWQSDPRYGIGLVGRSIHAIDIDIDQEEEALSIAQIIYDFFGRQIPTRRRESQARRLMLFRLSDNEDVLKKQVIHNKHGKVEFLFHRQQFIVAGMHRSGVLHYWENGLPTADTVPVVSVTQFRDLYQRIKEKSEDSSQSIWQKDTAVQVAPRDIGQIDENDPEYQAVINSKYYRTHLPDGQIALYCPWQSQHSSTDGQPDENPTAVTYFPKGLGGRQESGFKCQHTSHGEKTIYHLREVLDYAPPELKPIPIEHYKVITNPEPPTLLGASKSSIPSTLPNLVACLTASQWLGVQIAFDEFLGTMQIKWQDDKWRDIADTDYTALNIHLMQKVGFKGVARELLKDAVHFTADRNRKDCAIEWLNGLKWDGIPRCQATAEDILGIEKSEYAQAVSLYLWTALAGRVLQAGVKADMVLVLAGRQGTGKSTFVRRLVPEDKNWVTDLSFAASDSDNSRQMRGRVVAEIAEMKGLNSKDEDHIKAWVTKGEDTWIPKYQENAVTLKRRFVLVGTTNYDRFLSDSTGNRRWLPLNVCATRDFINTDFLSQNIEQYWAEAAHLFRQSAIQWRKAEQLAKRITPRHVRSDVWQDLIISFLQNGTFGEPVSVSQIATGLGVATHLQNSKIQNRIEAILRTIGYQQDNQSNLWLPSTLI